VSAQFAYAEVMHELTDNVRRNVRRLRRDSNMTQVELAVKAGMARQGVSAFEERRSATTTLATVERFAAALGVPAISLLGAPEACPRCAGSPPDGFACNTCGEGSQRR
jgi:transcriptional regulator with XRE-family HTH domain